MIRIYRPDTIPPSLQPKKIAPLMKKMEAFYLRSTDTKKRQTRFDFDITPVRAAKEQLAKEFNNKCAYCESPIGRVTDADLEFFRSRSAKGFDNEFSNDHYWWLYYEWKNIFYCCAVCNRTKANWFPVEGKRVPVKTPYAQVIKKEKNLLIDPCNEDPAEHLEFDETGLAMPLSEKGKWTIEILQLNRDALVKQRKQAIDFLGLSLKILIDERLRWYIDTKTMSLNTKPIVEIFPDSPVVPYVGVLRSHLKRY